MTREIKQVKKSCLLETAVYAWGQNNHGQHSHSKIHTANVPVKVDLPDDFTLDEKDEDINSVQTGQKVYLNDIVCANRYSGLISSQGDLWLQGNMKGQA